MSAPGLTGTVVPVDALDEAARAAMLALMVRVYDGVTEAQFAADLATKHESILLRDDEGAIVRFSTARFLTVEVDGRPERGVFSGDTVIAPEH